MLETIILVLLAWWVIVTIGWPVLAYWALMGGIVLLCKLDIGNRPLYRAKPGGPA